jgi:hypothetical protein
MKENSRRNVADEDRKDFCLSFEYLLAAFVDLTKYFGKIRDFSFRIISDFGSRLFSMRTSLFYYNVNDMSATLFSCLCYKFYEFAKRFK